MYTIYRLDFLRVPFAVTRGEFSTLIGKKGERDGERTY